MNDARPMSPVPVPLLLLNGFGTLMLGAGMLGLFAPDVVPALARPAVAYALIGVGLTLDLTAAAAIVSRATKLRRNQHA
ncbi:MAG: hypothetical protein AB7O21_13970 [Gammaproteobacteria bacterium]